MSGGSVRLAYFVHDLSDPAVLKRVRMLRHAGAEVTVLGFHRTPDPPAAVAGAPVVAMGRTFDGRFSQRARAVAWQILRTPRLAGLLKSCDVIVGRTLEMLAIADAARAMHSRRARLVYECLDIHRLMLSPGLPGRVLRGVERRLLRRCDLLVVSSRAFERAYFEPFQDLGRSLRVPVLLMENKILDVEGAPAEPARRQPGPPWRIGWFGMLRCRRSFDILRSLARDWPGRIEVVIAGRPSEHVFADLAAEAQAAPGVTFIGAYRPEDLESMYHRIHFAWAIDYFEEGANSSWLLPNRIYESGRFGAVPVALRGVETGRWLADRGLGLLVQDPARELPEILARMEARSYGGLEARSRAAPRDWFTAGPEDCRALVQSLASAA